MAQKKIKLLKPIKANRADERAYSVAIQEQIIKPLLQDILIDFENAPPVGIAWRRILQEKIAAVMSDPEISKQIASQHINYLRQKHKADMIAAVQKAIGVDVNPYLTDIVLIRPQMEKAIEDNINLITSIPEKLLPKLNADFDEIMKTNAFDMQAMLKVVNRRFKGAQSHAEFIARDQTQKIMGQLNENRQRQLGIQEYIWQTMEDESVVGNPSGEYPDASRGHMNHYERNGKRFRWDSPPPDGHPGFAYNCRCVALAIIE